MENVQGQGGGQCQKSSKAKIKENNNASKVKKRPNAPK